MGINFKPSKIEARTPMEKFGLKKLSSIEILLKKFYEDESFLIRNIDIQTFKGPNLISHTTMKIIHHTFKPKGLHWNIFTKPKIEDMVVEIFGLKNQGIDKVKLEDISDDSYIY
jgi:predicted membrane protein